MSPNIKHSLSKVLKLELENRRIKNPRYSLRAFARDLGVSSGRLSEIINDEYFPGHKLLKRICTHLNLNETQIIELEKVLVQQRNQFTTTKNIKVLTSEEFKLVSSLESYAIFIMLSATDIVHEPQWIAKRLGLCEEKTKEALNRLLNLSLVKYENGKYKTTNRKITTSEEIPSKVIRDSHKEVLQHAITSLEQTPPELRDITSITLPVDISKLAQAKKHILAFRRKMSKLLEGPHQKEVYNLNIQLVPLTKVQK